MRVLTAFVLLWVFLAMVGSAVVSRQTFDRLPHLEDEYAYLFQARIFEAGQVYIPTPQPNRAYWQPFLINLDGKRFGKYPPGWPLLLALGTALNLPWVVNLWFSGLTVALVYRLGRELYDELAGVCAAILMTISPIALLLNGTLMSHTSTLFFVMLMVYSLWRLEQSPKALWRWAMMGGAALGIVIASRPLAAVGIAAPFVVYSGLRLLWILLRHRQAFLPALKPLLLFSLFTLLLASLFPAFNYLISGDPTANFYTLVWPYDRVGFGEGHGRFAGTQVLRFERDGIKINLRTHAGHNLERGKRNLRRDFKCYSRDLFGWVEAKDNPPSQISGGNDCLVDKRGLSWILLPLGLLFMRRRKWSVLLLALAGSLLAVHLAYWIGAGVYSARYYFEATAALALVSGAGVSGLAGLVARWKLSWLVYAIFAGMIYLSVTGYTPQRLAPLQGYGRISDEQIAQVEALRITPDTPVVVIAYGEHHWRDIGAVMALTDPYAKNGIIGLRDVDKTYTPRLVARYADRQILFWVAGELLTRQQFEAKFGLIPPA